MSAAAKKKRIVRLTSTFRRDLKKSRSHKKCDMNELKKVMKSIENRRTLGEKYQDHSLKRRYPGQRDGATDCRECHVCNDWLLVYRFPDGESVAFVRTGTHSDLF